MIELEAKSRSDEKPADLRKEGLIPAVYYGSKEDSVAIAVNGRDFSHVLREAGESSVVKLKTADGTKDVMIRDVQLDPLAHKPIHIDFYVVEKGQVVEVAIPLEFTGDSPAVKQGGTLVKVLHELPVKGEPAAMPHDIVVDITALVDTESQITTGDLKLPTGVELMIEPTEIVAMVSEAREEEPEEIVEVDMSAIEVEKKGKKEEEGEEEPA
jgi:large subunit ribosomal protein L25